MGGRAGGVYASLSLEPTSGPTATVTNLAGMGKGWVSGGSSSPTYALGWSIAEGYHAIEVGGDECLACQDPF